MARYLVTGGCGFIGANLVKSLLADGHDVGVVDDLSAGRRDAIPEHVDFLQADVADAAGLAEFFDTSYDGAFHLAANPSVTECLNDYSGCHRTNLTGTVAVFECASKAGAARGKPVPVVYASSCAVYGALQTLPLAEDMPTEPLSSYGADKLCCEVHGRMAAGAYGVPSVGLRFFNVFGVGQRPDSAYSGVLSIFCDLLVSSRQPTVYGDGHQTRDFIYVDDVVAATKAAMARAVDVSPAVFNVCTGQATTLRDVGAAIASICGVPFDPAFAEPRPGDIRLSTGDPSRCREVLGWESRVGLEDGLRRTIEWLAAGRGPD